MTGAAGAEAGVLDCAGALFGFGGITNGTVLPPGIAGAVCAGAGAGAGALFAGADLEFSSNTEAPRPALRVAMMESVIEVTMKITAEIVVAFESKVAEPRGPNAVCEPIPPNAPARSAALPLCSSMTMMRKKQTTMCTAKTR